MRIEITHANVTYTWDNHKSKETHLGYLDHTEAGEAVETMIKLLSCIWHRETIENEIRNYDISEED